MHVTEFIYQFGSDVTNIHSQNYGKSGFWLPYAILAIGARLRQLSLLQILFFLQIQRYMSPIFALVSSDGFLNQNVAGGED